MRHACPEAAELRKAWAKHCTGYSAMMIPDFPIDAAMGAIHCETHALLF